MYKREGHELVPEMEGNRESAEFYYEKAQAMGGSAFVRLAGIQEEM